MYRFSLSLKNDINVEDLRIGIFSYICAKQEKKPFVLRLNDIKKDKEIEKFLGLFGIKFENIHYKNDNLKFHLQFASKLLQERKAFSCFCDDNNLASKCYGDCKNLSDYEVLNNEKPFSIRIKHPNNDIIFKNELGNEISFNHKEIDDFIILEKDKYPTKDFVSAIDDMIQNVNHVIEKEKSIPNTPKQIHIRNCLGYKQEITYTHLPEILAEDKDFLGIKHLLEKGFLPGAIVNYLLLLGNDTQKKIFSLEDAIEWFDIKNISPSKARFDMHELEKINKKYSRLKNTKKEAKT